MSVVVVPPAKRGLRSKHQRLILVLLALGAMLAAALLAMSALRDQAAYFYTPSEARAEKVAPGRAIRLGGMVVRGSLKRMPDGLTIRFDLTDGKDVVPATYSGIAPDLFREGSGAIAEGAFDTGGTFRAVELLAKHDERYMPREMSGMRYDDKRHRIESTDR
jgi:cytochrome c-type biogenesis protein CcmE